TLGDEINTEFNDKTPYMHSDSKTLYFASDGHLGFGGFDVFLSRQNDDGSWSKPMNIGYPINTEQDEVAFVVSTDGRRVFYSGKDPKNPMSIDIFNFELYKEARPEKVVFVKGNLKDETGNAPKNATIELKTMESKNITKVNVDETDGGYAAVIRVKEDETVVLNVKADNMAFQSKLIETKPESQGVRMSDEDESKSTIQSFDFEVAEVKTGGVYKINDIFYATNSADISTKSKIILDEFVSYLAENKSIKIAIHGHTDNVGKPEANLALSTDRAFSVKQYLESKGIAGSRISYEGFGSQKPTATNETAEGRGINRRTEFVILSK
ncbi:MAG: OmpA family protein, partial [Salibacteraceae bacterium]|nr:OmpA family protein [Salibacteraceae bacterium]